MNGFVLFALKVWLDFCFWLSGWKSIWNRLINWNFLLSCNFCQYILDKKPDENKKSILYRRQFAATRRLIRIYMNFDKLWLFLLSDRYLTNRINEQLWVFSSVSSLLQSDIRSKSMDSIWSKLNKIKSKTRSKTFRAKCLANDEKSNNGMVTSLVILIEHESVVNWPLLN